MNACSIATLTARAGLVLGCAALAALSSPAAPAESAEPLKLGVPPSAWGTPPPPAPNPGVQQLPAPETRTFVPPLSRPTRTGRAGIAVWGAPGTTTSPRGPGDPDSVGWAGGGVAAEWGATPRRAPSN